MKRCTIGTQCMKGLGGSVRTVTKIVLHVVAPILTLLSAQKSISKCNWVSETRIDPNSSHLKNVNLLQTPVFYYASL